MLTFGFIADNIVVIPKGLTEEEFNNKFARALFNHFFDIVEQGCTKFYTPFQNQYSCIALKTIHKISEIADIDLDINVLYPSSDAYEAAQNTKCFRDYDITSFAKSIIFSELTPAQEYTSSSSVENKSELQNFNILMNLVEECSIVVFYNSEIVSEQNSYVSTARTYCENYSIFNTNLYGKIL